MDDFEVSVAGTLERSNFIGIAAAARLSDGVYVWSPRFDDGDMRDVEAEELAHALVPWASTSQPERSFDVTFVSNPCTW